MGLFFVQCVDDDDNGNVIEQATCDDGIQNGDEEGIDCGEVVCLVLKGWILVEPIPNRISWGAQESIRFSAEVTM